MIRKTISTISITRMVIKNACFTSMLIIWGPPGMKWSWLINGQNRPCVLVTTGNSSTYGGSKFRHTTETNSYLNFFFSPRTHRADTAEKRGINAHTIFGIFVWHVIILETMILRFFWTETSVRYQLELAIFLKLSIRHTDEFIEVSAWKPGYLLGKKCMPTYECALLKKKKRTFYSSQSHKLPPSAPPICFLASN